MEPSFLSKPRDDNEGTVRTGKDQRNEERGKVWIKIYQLIDGHLPQKAKPLGYLEHRALLRSSDRTTLIL